MNCYVVICLDDQPADPAYTLATRRLFSTLGDAQAYAITLAPNRLPIVVSGRWLQLRPPPDVDL